MFERIAIWYFRRLGRIVLPRYFIGLAIGGAAIAEIENVQDGWTTYKVLVPSIGDAIVLNRSILLDCRKQDSAQSAE